MSKHSSILHIPFYGPVLLIGLIIGEIKIAAIMVIIAWAINIVLWIRADFKIWRARQPQSGIPIRVRSNSGERIEYL